MNPFRRTRSADPDDVVAMFQAQAASADKIPPLRQALCFQLVTTQQEWERRFDLPGLAAALLRNQHPAPPAVTGRPCAQAQRRGRRPAGTFTGIGTSRMR